jgi:uncharacterized protein YndB with AHSA1/START domain
VVPDRIEREILIDAPREVVWAVVTDPEHVAEWFSDSADIELRPGGRANLTWQAQGTTVHGRVERVEPPRFFSFRWVSGSGIEVSEDNTTLVEFTLSPEGEGTRLRVVESGFADLAVPDEEKGKRVDEHREGWKLELGELSEYVAKRVRTAADR